MWETDLHSFSGVGLPPEIYCRSYFWNAFFMLDFLLTKEQPKPKGALPFVSTRQSVNCLFILKLKVLFFFFAQPGEYVDMVKAGIIDPLKVIRTALVDAAR